MKQYSLGLDIGISSVGWSVVDLVSGEIVDLGVRLFEEGTAADNLKRRTMRSGRRLKRRRSQRIEDARELLAKYSIWSKETGILENPYAIRFKGLSEKLSNEEFATAFLHIVKRRGSSFEAIQEEKASTDEQSSKAALSANDQLIREGKFPCQIQLERLTQNGKIREHKNNFRTSHYALELEKILSNQGFPVEFNQSAIELIKRRRMYFEGPGSLKSPTSYGRFIKTETGEIISIDLIEKMRGHCSVFPEELRAPKKSPTAELFNFLNDLNNLTIISQKRKLTEFEKRSILEERIYNGKHSATPNEIAKSIGVHLDDIEGFRVDKSNKPLLSQYPGLSSISKAIDNSSILDDFDLLDEIANILTKAKSIEERMVALQDLDHPYLTLINCQTLSQLSGFTQYHSLSLKAIRLMIEDLIISSDNQMQILSRKQLLSNRLDELRGLTKIPTADDSILSPVAKKSRQEAMKIVNAARKKFGEFENIVIEMPRDKNSDEQKTRIKDEQKEFEKFNMHCMELAGSNDINGNIRKKIRLYEQQDGKCAYTGKPLDLNLILNDSTAYEIDHIIPISISLDDSMQNKVLVTHKANQEKGRLTPIMAFRQKCFTDGWDESTYISYVTTQMRTKKIGYRKAYYLLFDKDITKYDVMKEFINRNLVDTRYASRAVLNTLQDYFKANLISTKIITVKGAMTAAFRSKINLEKSREANHYHHAIDATIIALLAKQDYLNKVISNIESENGILDIKENFEPKVLDENEFFNPMFMKMLAQLKKIEAVKISYKVDRKPNRKISDETIYSTRTVNNEVRVVKKYKNIYDPKDNKLALRIVNDGGKDLLMYRNDPQTLQKLKSIVEDYQKSIGPVEKENPFYLYSVSHGKITKYSRTNKGPAIDSVKYLEDKLGNHVDVTKNYMSNPNPIKQKKVVLLQVSPYRTDVYQTLDGSFKFVTIRYSNLKFLAKESKYKIDLIWYSLEKTKKGIDDKAIFLFSLNRNDYLEISSKTDKNGSHEVGLWRFIATNNDLGNLIEVKPIHFYDQERKMITIGKKIVQLRKFTTDILGNRYEIEKEELKLEFK